MSTQSCVGHRPVRILFVCVENSNRSQMAEAFAHLHGGTRVEAFSAGSKPSGRINERAIRAMGELGYDLRAQRSKGLTEVPHDGYDAAITMGCGDACPMVDAKLREDWDIPDPKNTEPVEFRTVRDLIEERVRALLARLSIGARQPG